MRDSLRRYGQHALLLVALVLVAVLGWSNRSLARENGALWDRVVRPYRGYVVPAFTARAAADGREITVAGGDSSAGQVLFVFSKACHFCTETLPTWRAVTSALAVDRDHLQVIGVSLDSGAVPATYATENHLAFPVVQFPDARTRAVFRAREVPLTMVVDGQGHVLYAATGLLRGRPAVDSVVTATREALLRRRAAISAAGGGSADKKT